MPEEVGFFALDPKQKFEAPIHITEGGIAIGGTALPGVIVDGEVYIDQLAEDSDSVRTITVTLVAEGGVVLSPELQLETTPDGRTRVRWPDAAFGAADGEGVGTPSPRPPGGLGA